MNAVADDRQRVLHYQPTGRWWTSRRRVVAIAAVLSLTVIGGAGFFARDLLAEWKTWVELRWAMRQCEQHTPPGSTIVYQYDPAWLNSNVPGYWAVVQSYAGIARESDLALCFLHTRTTPKGRKQLIAFHFSSMGTGSAEPSPTGEWLVWPERYKVAGLGAEVWCYRLPRRIMPFLCPAGPFVAYAGQPDPDDPTRFTVRYTIGDREGFLSARLGDDGALRLVPSIPLNADLENLKSWLRRQEELKMPKRE